MSGLRSVLRSSLQHLGGRRQKSKNVRRDRRPVRWNAFRLEALETRELMTVFHPAHLALNTADGIQPLGMPGRAASRPPRSATAMGSTASASTAWSATVAVRRSPSSTPSTTRISPTTCTSSTSSSDCPTRPSPKSTSGREQPAGRRRRLGRRDRAGRRVGPRHRAEGQHPPGRGRQRFRHEPAGRRGLRPPSAGRGRRVDELGGRRVLRRIVLRLQFHDAGRPHRGHLRGLVRGRGAPAEWPAISPNVLGRRRHEPASGRRRQLPERNRLGWQRRRHQRIRVPAGLPERRGHPDQHPAGQPGRGLRRRPEDRGPGVRLVQQRHRGAVVTVRRDQRRGPHSGRPWWRSPTRAGCWPGRRRSTGRPSSCPCSTAWRPRTSTTSRPERASASRTSRPAPATTWSLAGARRSRTWWWPTSSAPPRRRRRSAHRPRPPSSASR